MQVYGYLFHDTGFRHLVAVYWLLHSAFCFTILLRTIRYKFFNLTSLIFNLAFPLSDFENQGWFLSSQLPEAKEDGQLSVLYSLAFAPFHHYPFSITFAILYITFSMGKYTNNVSKRHSQGRTVK